MGLANQNILYTWRNEWTSPFISPWGLFERFKYANSASSNDLVQIFGIDYRHNSNFILKKHSDLLNLAGMDMNKFESILGGRFKQDFDKFNQVAIASLNENLFTDNFIRHHLAFCPSCLKNGYHSLFHQHKLITKCPFHMDKLVDGCPACGYPVPYTITFSKSYFAFQCTKCSHLLHQPDRLIKIWNSNDYIVMKDPVVKQLFAVEDSTRKRLERCFIPSHVGVKHNDRTLKSIIDILSDTDRRVAKEWFKTKKITPSTVTERKPPDCFNGYLQPDCFNGYLHKYLFQQYKAIARNIRKTILNGRKHEIRAFVRASLLESYTPPHEVVAYVRWRQETEKLRRPTTVENGKEFTSSIPASFQMIENYFLRMVSHSKLFNDIVGNEDLQNNREKWPVAVWLLSRVFGHFIIHRFKQWLTHVHNSEASKNIYIAALDAPEYDCPGYLFDGHLSSTGNIMVSFYSLNTD